MASKDRAYPRIQSFDLLTNIRLGSKGLSGTNTSFLGPFIHKLPRK